MSDSQTNSVSDDSSSSLLVEVNTNSNYSINGTSYSLSDKPFFTDDFVKFLFIAITIITIFICLAVCIIVCICICVRRKRKSKQKETKDQLLPEQSKKTSKIPTNKSSTTTGKQGSIDQIISSNPTIKTFYYDNLDDIPFIDESRPTSVIDITKV